MASKRIHIGDITYLDALPVFDKDNKKARYERKIREKKAVEDFKRESFGLLQKEGSVNKKNTELLEPVDITTIYHT
jgi:hypothetical protein